MRSFKDKEVQRDAKLVSYKIVDKGGKPYVEVMVKDEKKVGQVTLLAASHHLFATRFLVYIHMSCT